MSRLSRLSTLSLCWFLPTLGLVLAAFVASVATPVAKIPQNLGESPHTANEFPTAPCFPPQPLNVMRPSAKVDFLGLYTINSSVIHQVHLIVSD